MMQPDSRMDATTVQEDSRKTLAEIRAAFNDLPDFTEILGGFCREQGLRLANGSSDLNVNNINDLQMAGAAMRHISQHAAFKLGMFGQSPDVAALGAELVSALESRGISCYEAKTKVLALNQKVDEALLTAARKKTPQHNPQGPGPNDISIA